MADPILEVKNLHVHFETHDGTAEVINGIDFAIDRGETAALVGETGCGKSVTVKSIMGLLPSATIPEGEIRYKGEDVLSLSDAERHSRRGKEMSMIMQDPMTSLNPVLTVGEQMMDVLKWQGRPRLSLSKLVRDALSTGAKAEHRKRAIEMLGEVEISAPERVFESYPVELSGGMRQRVLIAIALLSEPDLLIADEPGTALDVTTEAKVLDLLDELVEERDTSVLYITHDLGVAREVSDRINVMYAGEIVEQAPTADLFANPQHPYTRGLLESIPTLSTGIGDGIEGHLPDYTNPPAGCRFADRCPHAEPDCHEAYPYPRQTGPDHATACHLFDGLPARERHESLAAERVDIGTAPWLSAGGDTHSGDAPGDISADGGTDQ
ncbi:MULTISPECIES: ABC transporter ATP-binding protein [unclassified Haloferax]|uniref:ABC transporter ATP-binding protein n=1 Tax=unclassified Haloferax TaxID=2625095 RepID=UPI000737BAA7|nr:MULTISPECIES: ABC transporter ATP-binding protein [unclassified Haloferax]MCO8267765.1 ABC transporter ATP-binding protein [Haloferax sp. AB510]